MQRFFINLYYLGYTYIARPFIFLFNSETVHKWFVDLGELFGRSEIFKKTLGWKFKVKNKALAQNVAGIEFKNPIGLAAGFDYRAKLTQILPSLGFGFETVGTITNGAYEGNPGPRLGRLVKSRSLLVNKGFKNDGIHAVLEKLQNCKFEIPVGISIGKTNGEKEMSQEEAVQDILSAFRAAESSSVPFSYYELNISCPNLHGNVEFYSTKHLHDLLQAVSALNLSKPLFIKMPIDRADEESLEMLKVISGFPVQGVIFGNLQKDRQHPELLPEEVVKHGKGNFSGKPTEKRSNELIALAYKNYGKKLMIIGCGGVFSAEDAYKKIKNGASLVQLITGLVFEGPELAAKINLELLDLLKKDGFKNIGEAVGFENK